jgi:hypothetical protein
MTRTEEIQDNMRAAMARVREKQAQQQRAEPPRDSGIRLITDRQFESKLRISRSSRKRLDKEHATILTTRSPSG